jgi:hypothetical protein
VRQQRDENPEAKRHKTRENQSWKRERKRERERERERERGRVPEHDQED